MKTKKIIPILIILATLLLSINYIFFPAYLSVKSSCDPIGFEETYGDKYITAGQVTIEPSTEGECTITFFLADEENIPVKMHELCHLNQINREYPSLSCSKPIQKYLSEVECYSVQRFWEVKGLF